MRRVLFGLITTGALYAAATAGAASLGDKAKEMLGGMGDGSGDSSSSARQLPESEVISGLKGALADGASAAVTQLGQTDGFWGNQARRIPLPGWMNNAATVLKGAGMGGQMQDLQLSMNRAAEQATAEAGPIVRDTINNMSVADGYNILNGSDTAATDYLRDNASSDLVAKFEPIIKQTTAQSTAVSTYESLVSKAKPMLQFVPGMKLNLNEYVTQQAMDGLFAVIGQQEAKIRQNPAAAGSSIVKKVFSAAQ